LDERNAPVPRALPWAIELPPFRREELIFKPFVSVPLFPIWYRQRRLLRYDECMGTITDKDLQRDPLGMLLRVEHGEALLVLRGEQPVAEIKPAHSPALQPRPYGLCAGQFTVPSGFDQPLPQCIVQDFEDA
jgi:antitoxin (DNA-binding transcriptional repressor) of toxin-antitoxin stability system